jgi:hypothetical protein
MARTIPILAQYAIHPPQALEQGPRPRSVDFSLPCYALSVAKLPVEHVLLILFLLAGMFIGFMLPREANIPRQVPACLDACNNLGLVPLATPRQTCVCGGYGITREVQIGNDEAENAPASRSRR